jgi:hypothetical protein
MLEMEPNSQFSEFWHRVENWQRALRLSSAQQQSAIRSDGLLKASTPRFFAASFD